MVKKLVLGMICCGIALGGCATRNAMPPAPHESAPLELQTGVILEQANLSVDEKAAFNIALGDLEQYLVRRFGKSKLRELNEQITQSSDLYESLKETYETDPVSLLSEFSRRPSRRAGAVRVEWLTRVSDHFVFQYHPGSSAERDMEIIVREAENALTGACTKLGFPLEHLETKLDSLREVRDSVSGLYGVKGGELVFTDGRIPVILTEDSEEYREFRGDKYSSGVNRFNSSGTVDGRLIYRDHLISYYLDVFQLFIMNHEIVHAVHFLASAADDAVWRDYLKRRMDSEGEAIVVASDEFDALVHPVNMDKYVVEGLATWYCARYGLVPRALNVPTVRHMVADVMPTWKNVDLGKITEWKVSLNFFEKAMTVLGKEQFIKREFKTLYLGAGCFIEYIVDEYGPYRVHMLMSCTKGNASDCIRDVFGMDIERMDRSWKQWVMNPSSGATFMERSKDVKY